MKRSVIIVSPYFPPSTLAGVHRARHLAKYLPAAGWTPIIVCVDEAFHEQRLDPELAKLVPQSAEIVKVKALSPRLCRPLGFGEISLRAWFSLRRKVLELLKSRQIDTVLITGSPFYPMMLAREIKRRFKVPVVLDFQDPWVSSWGAKQTFLSKAGLSHKLATLLEPIAVEATDFITSVSEKQNEELHARYPHLAAERMAAIPIGVDPDDYKALGMMPATNSVIALDPTCFNLSYVGTIWPAVIDTVRTMLQSLAEVRNRRPDVYSRLRLNFVGTTKNPNASDGCWVRSLAEGFGVADAVREYPERLPYLEALSLQVRSDAILVLGSLEPHYTASKIYGVMMSGRPYISVFHRESSSHQILSRAGGGIAIEFGSDVALLTTVSSIADAIVRLAIARNTFGCTDPAAYRDFCADEIAKRFADVFDRLLLRKEPVS